MTRPLKRNTQAGITLIELMISLVIVSIAVAATMSLGYSMMDGYREQRRSHQVEAAARASLELVADAIRNSSPGVPNGAIEDLVGCSIFGGLQATNNIDAPDELELVYASGGVLTSVRSDYSTGDTNMEVLDGSGFVAGDLAVITDFAQGHLVQVTAVIDNGASWNLSIAPACAAAATPTTYGPGKLVLRARLAHFFVDSSAAVGGLPTLMMDADGPGPQAAEPLAAGIEDMQIAVGIDQNADGIVFDNDSSTDEWFYNDPADLVPPPMPAAIPRALRVTFVARSVAEGSTVASYIRPAVEDHAAAGAPDVFRRRVLSATVEIRNLQGSPP